MPSFFALFGIKGRPRIWCRRPFYAFGPVYACWMKATSPSLLGCSQWPGIWLWIIYDPAKAALNTNFSLWKRSSIGYFPRMRRVIFSLPSWPVGCGLHLVI